MRKPQVREMHTPRDLTAEKKSDSGCQADAARGQLTQAHPVMHRAIKGRVKSGKVISQHSKTAAQHEALRPASASLPKCPVKPDTSALQCANADQSANRCHG